uniref:G-protein coupled receptors family 3 profile domain-containing protein n=1 Tax=Xenopus tropicalis TaxID=8364 RepID=A0A6I8QL44_XENTR
MQALIFAVEEINADPDLLPNITLGFHIFDTCTVLRRAAEGTLWMLSGGKGITPNYRCHKTAPLAGIVGDSGSSQSILMAQILGLSQCPQLSYLATSPLLGSRDLFPSFFRTIPSDEFQIRGLVKLIIQMGWSWLGILASDDDYGQFGVQIAKQEISTTRACVAFTENILTGQPNRNAPHLVQVIKESSAKVVLVIATGYNFVIVVEELLRQNMAGITWIASQGWATSLLLSENRFRGVLTGAVGFAIHSGKMVQFTNYLNSLRNEKPESLLPSGKDYRESLNVYTAVYAIAWALHNLLQWTPGNGPFPHVSPPTISSFQPWQVKFCLLHNQVTNFFSYSFLIFNGKDHRVSLNQVKFYLNGSNQVPVSKCSPNCPAGFRKVIIQGKPPCCYECGRCPPGQISNQTDAVECHPCSWDTWPNLQQDRCLPRPTEFLSYGDPLGYSLAAISIFSSLIPLGVLGVFIHQKKTPIVRANNYSLSCLLLLSLFLCFLCSLGFIGYPQPEKCLLRQVAFGMVFALCISCVLAKTITVVIAFNATKPGSRLRKWTGVKVSYCVIMLCALIQITDCALWLIFSPPFHELDVDTKPGVIIVNCNEGSPTAFWCMLGYLGLLASISFIVAFLARRLPDSFNEAKLITFSMLAFLSVWVSFIPAYLSARGMYTVAMEVFAILSSSWAVVGCIFVPKCYIILFRPNMNSREHLMGKDKNKK